MSNKTKATRKALDYLETFIEPKLYGCEEYYKPPADEVFKSVQRNAIKIWKGYDDTYGYSTNKVNAIKDLTNIEDNCAYIVAMFDQNNQKKLFISVNENAKKWMSRLNRNLWIEYRQYKYAKKWEKNK